MAAGKDSEEKKVAEKKRVEARQVYLWAASRTPLLNKESTAEEVDAAAAGLREAMTGDTYCKTTGPKIMILTNHKNLEYWKPKKDLNLRQAWWGERLANYDFVIKYRPWKLAGQTSCLESQETLPGKGI